jgi:hypothetical protein
MKQKILNFLIALLSLLPLHTIAQSGLSISSGTNFFISSGTIVSLDSLVLTPSANYNITGVNSETRDATATPAPLTSYIQRVFHIQATPPPYSGDISIYYRDAELNSLNENMLNLNVYNGSTWNAYTASARDAVNNFVTTSGLSAISMNELTLAAGSALPVTLSAFTVQSSLCIAHLAWTTATEINSKQFEVQQSFDGVNFTTIGIVAASGNSAIENHYSFSKKLISQTNYFRLLMLDMDGASKFSPVLSVTGNCSNNVITIYPNPVKDILYIDGLQNYHSIEVIDITGRIVQQQTVSAGTGSINVHSLSKGNYILKLKSNAGIQTLKFIKD